MNWANVAQSPDLLTVGGLLQGSVSLEKVSKGVAVPLNSVMVQ